jgi:hypothetical protein
MYNLKRLDTLSLRQLYYLLSIDLWSNLSSCDVLQNSSSRSLAHKLCLSAVEHFGMQLDEEEIDSLFIQPLISYLQLNTSFDGRESRGQYALSAHHFEFTSALQLFLAGISR